MRLARDRLLSWLDRGVARAAGVGRALALRPGAVGRVARALDREVSFAYLEQLARSERLSIERFRRASAPARGIRCSIVVPTFGIDVAYLKEMFASLQSQTYEDWELCLCDDGDPSPAVIGYLDGLASQWPQKVRLVRHSRNQGICQATLSALAAATGDVVVFVDADDILHRCALELVVQRFSEDAAVDVVYTDHDLASDLGFRRVRIRKPAWSPELLLSYNYINHMVAVRRDCLERCGTLFGQEVHGAQDWDLCLRLSRVARRVSHIPLALYHWRQRPGSVSHGGAMAKPWAIAGAATARRRHFEALGSGVVLPPNADSNLHAEPCLGGETAAWPKLLVIKIDDGGHDGAAPAPSVRYPGPWEERSLPLREAQTLRAAYRSLQSLLQDTACDAVWLLDARHPLPDGPVDAALAYAVLPGVGGVWPFRSGGLRLAYTLDGATGELCPLGARRGTFSICSGNILTGPLHGLLARRLALLDSLALLIALADPMLDQAPLTADALGATVGLGMLGSRYRNVACQALKCDAPLSRVTPPAGLRPESDPYL